MAFLLWYNSHPAVKAGGRKYESLGKEAAPYTFSRTCTGLDLVNLNLSLNFHIKRAWWELLAGREPEYHDVPPVNVFCDVYVCV